MTEDSERFPSWYEVAAFLKEKGFHFGADPDTYDYAPCVEVNFFPSSLDFSDANVQIAETAAREAIAAIQERWPNQARIGPDNLIIAHEGWEVWMCDPPPILTCDPVALLKEAHGLLLKYDNEITYQLEDAPLEHQDEGLAEWQNDQAELHAFFNKLAGALP